MIIAIDGPSGSGKGTLAQQLATHFQLARLDTGLLYRAIAYKLLQTQQEISDVTAATKAAQTLHPLDMDNPALRQDEVAVGASKVAAYPSVRQALTDFQRAFAHHPPAGTRGSLLDGRDIGTFICPEADFKFFLTADLETRAQRRFKELQERGIASIYTKVFDDMKERDLRDSQRTENPLKPAPDAYILDTSHLDIQEMTTLAMRHIEKALSQRSLSGDA